MNPYPGGTQKSSIAVVSAANTNRDGTGTLVDLVSGTANGATINGVHIRAVSTTTAGMIRFYLSNDSGTTNRLLDEVPVTVNASLDADEPAFNYVWVPKLPLTLFGTGFRLRASTHIAETFHLTSSYGDL